MKSIGLGLEKNSCLHFCVVAPNNAV